MADARVKPIGAPRGRLAIFYPHRSGRRNGLSPSGVSDALDATAPRSSDVTAGARKAATLIVGETWTFGSNHQRARVIEAILDRSTLPEHLVHGIRWRTNRIDWPERLGQIHPAGDSVRSREAGRWRGSHPQTHAPEPGHADFGIRAASNDPFRHRKRPRGKGCPGIGTRLADS